MGHDHGLQPRILVGETGFVGLRASEEPVLVGAIFPTPRESCGRAVRIQRSRHDARGPNRLGSTTRCRRSESRTHRSQPRSSASQRSRDGRLGGRRSAPRRRRTADQGLTQAVPDPGADMSGCGGVQVGVHADEPVHGSSRSVRRGSSATCGPASAGSGTRRAGPQTLRDSASIPAPAARARLAADPIVVSGRARREARPRRALCVLGRESAPASRRVRDRESAGSPTACAWLGTAAGWPRVRHPLRELLHPPAVVPRRSAATTLTPTPSDLSRRSAGSRWRGCRGFRRRSCARRRVWGPRSSW